MTARRREAPALTGPDRAKLPVPGPWQASTRVAMDHLCRERGLDPAQVTVTRVEALSTNVDELPAGAIQLAADAGNPIDARPKVLDIWLLGAGRSYRYRAVGGRVLPHGEP